MARTKRQVLLNAARKQQQHGLLREAAGIPDTPQPPHQGYQPRGQDKNGLQKTKPVPSKTENVKRDLQKSFGSDQKPNVCVNESLKDITQSEKIETVTSSSCYPDKKLSKRRQQDLSYSPSLGSIRQLKLTARKSTHCEKKAEAEQILAALMNSPNKTPTCSPQNVCPWSLSNSTTVSDLSPVLPISSSTPAKNTARKSMHGSAGSVVAARQRARKSISEYSSSFCNQVLAQSSDDTESDSLYMKIFPSVHEAVLTLPKCETLPVALVCINDVMRSSSPSVAGVLEQPLSRKSFSRRCDKPLSSPHRLSSSPEDDSSPIQLLKPAAKIKTKNAQKNIFDQFESEIKQNPKCSKSRPVGGLKHGSSDKHSPVSKTLSGSKRSTAKVDMNDAQTALHSPGKEGSESPSMCCSSHKGDNSPHDETEKKKYLNSKNRKCDTRYTLEKVARSQSCSPRCDSSSVVDDKSPRRRSPRRTPVERDAVERDGVTVLSPNVSEDESSKVENKNNKSPITPGSIKQIQSPGKSPQSTSRDKDEKNEEMCKDNDNKSEENSSMHTGRSKSKLSPSGSKTFTVNSARTHNELKISEQSGTENCDKDKSNRDVEKLKSSANKSCEDGKKCGNLMDLISRVGNRLQDNSSAADFLNGLPETQNSHDNDSSSSISLTTSDAVEEEFLDTSQDISSSVSITSDDKIANCSISDSISSKNSLTSEQCLRKSPRRKVFPDECSKGKCDKLETDSSKTEDSMLQTSDDSGGQISDSKKLISCDQSIAIDVDCGNDTKPELNSIDVKMESDMDMTSKSLSELSPNKNVSQQHEANDPSFEGALLACVKMEEGKVLSKPNLRSSEKDKSCHRESLSANTEAKSHRWAGSQKTVEPSSLDVLCKPEKNTVDKRSAFVSDDLENFLSRVKNDTLKVEQTNVKAELADFSFQDLEDKNLEAFEPDFDEIEGVLFLSFANEDALKAHIAVEKKNHWDKDCNYFWGISRYKAFEQLRSENKTCEKSHMLRNLRGKHMKWKKYRRLLRRELNILRRNQLQTYVKNSTKIPSKTSDITKIKGWRKKYGGRNHFKSNMGLNVYGSGKIHWRTEARLLRNMKADDIKALGIAVKKKRRKNVIFTNRKRSTREIENRLDYPQDTDDQHDDDDDDDIVLGEVEDTVLSSGHSSRGSDCEYIYESDHALENASEFKRLGVVKSTFIRKDFVNQFNWDEKDEQIHKKLGGRVRNRHKKNDPQDMRELLETFGGTTASSSPEVIEVPKKKRRQKFIPFVVLSKEMVKEAVKALFGEAVEPNRHKPRRKLKRSSVKSGTASGSEQHAVAGNVSMDCSAETVEAIESSSSKNRHHSGDECDKPGHISKPCSESCRYGCICHLCDSTEEQEEMEQTDWSRACDREYCRLGCICDSLDTVHHSPRHCSRPECHNTCVCTRGERYTPPHSTDEPSAIFEDRGETNFEDLPPSLDKLGSIDKKTLDETSDKTKMLEEILEKKKRSKKKSSVDPEYTPPDDDVTKKQTPGIEESKKKTRLPRGDRFGNLPRRESMHRTSKNLDAVTRKAMMLYEMSEIYWEAGERKRRLGLMAREDSVSETPESKSCQKSGSSSVPHTADVSQSATNNSNDEKHLADSTTTPSSSTKSKTKSSHNQNKMSKVSTRKTTRIDSGGEVPETKYFTRSAVAVASKDSITETDVSVSSTGQCEPHDATATIGPKNKTKSASDHVRESKQQPVTDSTKEVVNAHSLTDDSKVDTTKIDELSACTTNSEDYLAISSIKTESSDLSENSVEILEKLSEEPILISGDESDAEDEMASKSNSRRSSESTDNKADVGLFNVIDKIKKLTEDLKQKKNELKMRNSLQQQQQYPQNPVHSNPPLKSYMRDPGYDQRMFQWHTQMVCLKANPKPRIEGGEDNSHEIKLLEFIANCNWDNAKSQVLSRVAQCLNRGVYPNPKKMIVSDYLVEILPKADRPACIPPELREKLPETMFSIRVKVTKKSDPVDFSHMKVLVGKSSSLVQQQLQKSKSMMSKIPCDSASNRVFNKMNNKQKEYQISVNIPVSAPVGTVKPLSAPATSTTKQISKSEDLSKPQDDLVISQKQLENIGGISGLSQMKISQPDLSDVSLAMSQRKTVKLGSQTNPSRKKKKKIRVESDDLGQIVIENAETGAMKPLLYGHNDDFSEQKNSTTMSPNKRKRKQDIACTKTFESAEGIKTDDDDDDNSILTECDDSQGFENSTSCSVNDQIQSNCLKSGVGKKYVIDNGSLIENKSLPPAVVSGTSHPTPSVEDLASQARKRKPIMSACKQTYNVQQGKKPLLLPAPLKAGQLLGPFSNLSDLKFITLPGSKDQSKTLLQLVSTSSTVCGQPQQIDGSKPDYIAIPVTFKDDKLQALNTFSVSACNGVKTKTLNSEEETTISCSAIGDNADSKNSAPQSEPLSTDLTPEDTNKRPKKKSARKKKLQEVRIEKTNQIVYLKTFVPAEKKVKRKRPVFPITQETLDDYADTIAQVASVGKVAVTVEPVDGESSQSALAALLLTDDIISTSSKLEHAKHCSNPSDEAASAEDNDSVNQVITNNRLDVVGESQDEGSVCKADTSEILDEKMQSAKSKHDWNNCPETAVVSSSDSLAACSVHKVPNKEPVLTQKETTSSAENITSTISDVENVDPKDQESCSENISYINIPTEVSDCSVKRKLSESDIEDCSTAAKQAKINMNSSSDKLYDLIVNKVAGFPFPEDSDSENSMSVARESLDDCCERISMQITCEDGSDITQVAPSVSPSATQSLLQHQLSDCNSPLQGKRLSPKTQTPQTMQTTSMSECRLNKQLTAIAASSVSPTHSLLKPKCSLELAKMLLGDINQNFDRQQKNVNQNGCDGSRERISLSTSKNSTCSLQQKT